LFRRRTRREQARTVEPGRHVIRHLVEHELGLVRLAHRAKSRYRKWHADRESLERVAPADGVVGGFQIDQDLDRRESAVEGRRIGRILRQARVGPFRNIAHRCHHVAFDQPRLQEVRHHLIDILLARARYLRQRKLGNRLLGHSGLLDAGTEEASPPVLKPCPPPGVPLRVVAGADVRVRRTQVSVEQRDREARRSIVDVDICQTIILRD
jgi:hypothetical protein